MAAFRYRANHLYFGWEGPIDSIRNPCCVHIYNPHTSKVGILNKRCLNGVPYHDYRKMLDNIFKEITKD